MSYAGLGRPARLSRRPVCWDEACYCRRWVWSAFCLPILIYSRFTACRPLIRYLQRVSRITASCTEAFLVKFIAAQSTHSCCPSLRYRPIYLSLVLSLVDSRSIKPSLFSTAELITSSCMCYLVRAKSLSLRSNPWYSFFICIRIRIQDDVQSFVNRMFF